MYSCAREQDETLLARFPTNCEAVGARAHCVEEEDDVEDPQGYDSACE